MANRSGRFAIIEQLLANDIHYMFGNPGTVEEGFLDALGHYPDMHYILALHETVALGMADGYARATRQPTIVQLHSGVGLGNGIGMLYRPDEGIVLSLLSQARPACATMRWMHKWLQILSLWPAQSPNGQHASSIHLPC